MTKETKRPSLARSILFAGGACGVLDLTAALVVYGSLGIAPMRLLQGISTGLLGRAAYDGGAVTAALGVACHFVIAFSAASVFVIASRTMRFLLEHPIVSGVVYGPIVYFFMQYVVVSLSYARRSPFSLKFTVIGLVIHVFCVGLPIAIGNRLGRLARLRPY